MSQKNILTLLNPELFEVIWHIGRQADENGFNAYVVGGVVRDLFLKKKNIKDVDVVVEGDVVNFTQQLAKYFKAESVVHPEFRTATLFLN
ncbi:MAG: hypothetical protein HQL25_00890, partial [Candidatus Omnitrophica bacterium]|nr:hypothetical protein [Candidatus Omnitrophota bacterium]